MFLNYFLVFKVAFIRALWRVNWSVDILSMACPELESMWLDM